MSPSSNLFLRRALDERLELFVQLVHRINGQDPPKGAYRTLGLVDKGGLLIERIGPLLLQTLQNQLLSLKERPKGRGGASQHTL